MLVVVINFRDFIRKDTYFLNIMQTLTVLFAKTVTVTAVTM